MSVHAFGPLDYRRNRRALQDSLQRSKVIERWIETGIWRDEQGYDEDGFDKNGFNRFGFDRNNRHKDGSYRAPDEQEIYFEQQRFARILAQCDQRK